MFVLDPELCVETGDEHLALPLKAAGSPVVFFLRLLSVMFLDDVVDSEEESSCDDI